LPDTTGTSNFKVGLQIPIKVGYKFIFDHHFFVMAEIGDSIFSVYYDDVNDQVASTKLSGVFTFAGAAGVQFGSYELGIKYETISVTGGSISNIGLRTGVKFLSRTIYRYQIIITGFTGSIDSWLML
jgi:hypothetical protein